MASRIARTTYSATLAPGVPTGKPIRQLLGNLDPHGFTIRQRQVAGWKDGSYLVIAPTPTPAVAETKNKTRTRLTFPTLAALGKRPTHRALRQARKGRKRT